MELYIILALVNLVLLGLLFFEYYKHKKKISVAIIYNKYGQVMDNFKINPSYDRIKRNYENNQHSYIMDKEIPPIKYNNINFYFWEFNKPEQVSILKDFMPIMDTSTLNSMLEMEKIKALNTPSNNILDGLFSKKNLIIGAIVIVGIIVATQTGVF